jgi:hypothetical protein
VGVDEEMNLWQPTAADKMANFIKDFLPVNEIIFNGSIVEPNTLDMFSDVDMKILLSDNTSLNIANFIQALPEQFFPVFGYEIHNHNEHDVLRLCFENGWRFDFTFIYPQPRESQATDSHFFYKLDSVTNQFWFLAVSVLIRLGRNDFLIAAHLALELCQLNIVIQMLIRDEEKKTNIHRYGDGEDVPVLHSLLPNERNDFSQETKSEILNVLFASAKQMDKILLAAFPKYKERSEKLIAMRHQLNGQL